MRGRRNAKENGVFPLWRSQPIEVHHFIDMALMKLSRLISPEATRCEVVLKGVPAALG